MEDLEQLMASLFQNPAAVASESFDKQALLQLHESARQRLRNLPAGIHQTSLSFTDPIGSSGTASSVPLETLDPISLTQLKIGEVHRGRVLYGTLCVEAFRMSGIMTLLEDDNGLAVRMAIYNAAPSRTNIKTFYPKGAKVAIRDPYFKRSGDDSIVIRVDNPANLEILVTQKKQAESMQLVDVEEIKKKGNSCFREKQWDSAAVYYTKCIDAALFQLKKMPFNEDNNIKTCSLHAYSNRAEARLQMKEFELALEDSDKALGIESGNLKALYRKGRALIGLKQYAAACKWLEKADKISHGQNEVQDALRQAKNLYAQSRNGNYDLSDYFLGCGTSPPDVADFIGPVKIKMTQDGRGRGLYATREISTGQLLLVSNAVAVAYQDNHSSSSAGIHVDHRGNINLLSQEDLVAVVVSAARSLPRLLQQLYTLDSCSLRDRPDVPAIDLFRTEGQMSLNEVPGKGKLQLDVNRIRDIISRNSFGGGVQTFASKSKMYEAQLAQQSQSFSGLWLLPSFINHSCLPNSSRLEVGSAMFIHACKPIKRGEEITISYFDTLVPLTQRQAMCKNWGFKCKCKRCTLELSLRAALEPITTRFEQLHDKALEETNAARSEEHFDADLPACAEFAKLFVGAEEIIRKSVFLKAEEQNWIRASFVSAYLAGTQSNDFFLTMISECIPSGEEVMCAIQYTVPGDIRGLIMVSHQLHKDKYCLADISRDTFIGQYASDQARKACIRVFGKHSEDVLKALVLQHSKCHVF